MDSHKIDNKHRIFSTSLVKRQTEKKLNLLDSYLELDLTPTAIIYCEANFTKSDGKTANGLIRYSPNFHILSVIDSEMAGFDAGYALDMNRNGVPIYSSLSEAIGMADEIPNFLIYGLAKSESSFSDFDRMVILEAMVLGMNIIHGTHQCLNEDPEFITASMKNGVSIYELRKLKNTNELHTYSGIINRVKCPRVAIMGTDCAIGKRTTALKLTSALSQYGLKAIFIATGQTGLMQGTIHGLVMDSIPAQFCPGELEYIIHKAYKTEKPDIIIVEGQGALSHPAYSTSAMILRGCAPSAVILQHAPKRKHRVDFEHMPMPLLSCEIELIELFAHTRVIGICLNHENMTDEEVEEYIYHYSKDFSVPVTDALSRSSMFLVHMILNAFPHLEIELPTIQ